MSSQQKEEKSKYPMAVIGAIATVLVLVAIYYAGSSSHEKSGHGSTQEGHSSPIAPIGSVRVIGQKEEAAPAAHQATESSRTDHENEEAPALAEPEPAAVVAQVPAATDQPSSRTDHENEEAPAPAPAVASAKDTYNASCAMCHATGAAGAPKVGDKATWKPRIAQGIDTLVQHALKGFAGSSGVMPPKGGSMHLSDDQIAGIVEYMVSESQ
jgi:cytochrome c5